MKFFIVFAALFAVALAGPVITTNKDAYIVSQHSDVEPLNYNFGSSTSDGKVAEEQGHIEDLGTPHEAISVKGSFSYVGDDGNTYAVNYIADRNGFQPQGAHLPKAY